MLRRILPQLAYWLPYAAAVPLVAWVLMLIGGALSSDMSRVGFAWHCLFVASIWAAGAVKDLWGKSRPRR